MYAVPVLKELASKKRLKGLVVPAVNHPGNQPLLELAFHFGIPVLRVDKSDMQKEFRDWLLKHQPDAVLTFTFSYKVPKQLLSIPRFGFINVHFSLLPNFRGSFPVFWQMKNGDSKAGVSIHQMDANWDTGDILLQRELILFKSESQGVLSGRLTMLALEMIRELLEKMGANQLLPQKQSLRIPCFRKPEIADYTIQWSSQSSTEIENLVNASNPEIGGALTFFRGQLIRILEVESAAPLEKYEMTSGTIVLSDRDQGLYVACNDSRCLRIRIISTMEGYFSGERFAALGIRAGERMG